MTKPKSVNDELLGFTQYMAARNLSTKTRKEYFRDAACLLAFFERNNISNLQSVNLNHLNYYLSELDHQKLTGNTRRRIVAGINAFFKCLVQSGRIKVNPTANLMLPKKETTIPRVLSELEYKNLKLAASKNIRDLAIVELLLQTGIRLSELAHITTDQIELPKKLSPDSEPGTLVIKAGKARKDRIIALNYKAGHAIKNWLKVRPQADTSSLFISKFKQPITAGGYQWIIAKYLQEANIKNAHVHTLRHTFGTHMAKKGANLRVIQEMMGHSNLSTTSHYISLARELMNKEVQNKAL